ncbi:porin family protein [Altibacter lentus]|uniref:porin family protein n=1 Tax=Altibacter lentus TaxID=1223410 RepID=UPI00055307BE|nr:porin family protein [Altibacter lentus]
MKKVMLMLICLPLAMATANAQEVKLGVKAGVNFAKLTGDAVEDADGRTGFHLGGVVEIPVSETFAVQPEVLYSQQGLQQETDFFGDTLETKLKLDYINVPVMAKYYVTDGLSIEAGPQFGFNVKAETEISVEGDSDGDEIEGTTDVSDSVSGFDLGLGGGLAYQLNNGVFFQARYMFGISNVDEDDDEGFIGDNLTNSTLSFSAGIKF